MAPHYERLSAQDNSFLLFDRPNAFTHGAGTAVFRAGPLLRADGGIDVEPIRRRIESRLHEIPRFRQKLRWIPLERHPVWVDDPGFSLDYHLRHTRLPFPGDDAELKRLSARLLANRLDRSRPLWEWWVIEGLEGDRFALFQKLHHCMIDGASGVDLMQLLLSPRPDEPLQPVPHYTPRPEPSDAHLLWDAARRYAGLPAHLLHGARELGRSAAARQELARRARAVLGMLRSFGGATSETPLNRRIGPYRRVDWLSMSLDEIKALRRALGGTVNDVVLATVAGAVRSFLELRAVDPAKLAFRVAAPVSTRAEHEHGTFGNRVSQWIVDLPIGEADPLVRLARIRAQTERLKASGEAVAADVLFGVAEWIGTRLLSQAAQLAVNSVPFNLMVTNIPGPQIPLYLCGAEFLEAYGYVPLVETTALGIALMSSNGRLAWGFNADHELVPDLAEFVAAVRASFAALQQAARVGAPLARAEPRPARARRAGSRAATMHREPGEGESSRETC
jgi:WS/DGAT/MGAT family acyltransferase